MNFNEKIIELRKKMGLSQEELGNSINVSRQAISKWESGQSQPEVDKVKELSKVFNVSIEYLLNDDIDSMENINIPEKSSRKKILFKIIIILLSIYLLTVMYKFAVLLTYSIKANNIADYNNYNIDTDTIWNDTLLNQSSSYLDEMMFSNEIQISTSWDKQLNCESYISYINFEERIAYSLDYDYDIGKYVYNDLEKINTENLNELYTQTTIRKTTQENIPNNMKEIVLYALNPKVILKFDNEFLYIKKYLEKDGYEEIRINKNTGILDGISSLTEGRYFIEINYNYNFDDRFIDEYFFEEEYLKELEYIMYE